MTKFNVYLLILMSSVLLFGCEQQSLLTLVPKVIYGATEKDGVQYITTENPVTFNITSTSARSKIIGSTIYSYTKENGKEMLFDTLFMGQSQVSFEWKYSFPTSTDTIYAQLLFSVKTSNQEKVEFYVPCIVIPSDNQRFDYVELVNMYSASSEKSSAFGFTSLMPIFFEEDMCDSIYMYDDLQSDPLKKDILSCTWRGSKGCSFSRAGDIDYASINVAKMHTIYNCSMHYTTITDIRQGDVFVLGFHEKAFGVIKVILVSDEEGVENDKYTFSAKVYLKKL